MDIDEKIIVDAKKHYEKLLQICERIKQRGYWSEFGTINENVEQHIQSLFLEILGKEVGIDDEELYFINAILEKNYSKGRLVSEHARLKGKPLIQVPIYLTACIKMDLFDQTSFSLELIACIKNLGLALMIADHDFSEKECEFINAYISCIAELVERFGIKERSTGNSIVGLGKKEYINDSNCSEFSANNKDVGESICDILTELDDMTGLEKVKSEVKALVDLIKVRKIRVERGLPIVPMSFHLVFSGNPGTGKTTVARLISKLYNQLGLLPTDNVVEIDRAGLIAGYVGQTAAKVQEVINKALGGVLFIDEAYSLISENSENDFGLEAVSTLLKGMEDNRDKLIVIAAGYENEMDRFIDSNPGLRSRFSKHIHFEDYSPQQMLQILKDMCNNSGYVISSNVEEYAIEYFYKMQRSDCVGFGNGRGVRNYFEQAVSRQASRIVRMKEPDNSELAMLDIRDFKIDEEYNLLCCGDSIKL